MFKWNLNQIPILQLGSDFYDQVQPAVFPEKKLRYWNDSIELGLEKDRLWDFKALPDNLSAPLALRYHGHQFQHYNPNLGDGRGFLYAQVRKNDQWYDLGTKGSGQTPYSRAGDGRLTLKGAVREALATEMLESLGVKTSKTLCFFETGEALERNDEPSPTRSAVLTRFTLGHIRIGTFQRLAYFKQTDAIRKLVSYCLNLYYPDELKNLNQTDELLVVSSFLRAVVSANAKLVSSVMMAGFVHGVLNSDNINVSGELFDYGPYRFLPQYDPYFTAAYFDHQGLYCYGKQPAAFLWNLDQLAQALLTAYPELPAGDILENFSDAFNENIHQQFLKRLNLKSCGIESDSQLLSLFFSMLEKKKLFFEQSFFDFHSKRLLTDPQILQKYKAVGDEFVKLKSLLQNYEVNDAKKSEHAYLKKTTPCTLLIDEIELIWKNIADNDDWSLFENKLQSIRSFRGLYT
jgi:serine/tyrosine/threonine adenylyltransferase